MTLDAAFVEANLTALAAVITSLSHICRVTSLGCLFDLLKFL